MILAFIAAVIAAVIFVLSPRLRRGINFGAFAGQTQSPYRRIPPEVKQYVWRRDRGQCVMCGSNEALEYDHIIPVSKGGSNTERNVQLLCMQCNRKKHAKIM
jgi:5-methylcytosine-specific restriction endonuclease McrA